MVIPVVKYGCDNWIIKKTEHQRIDAFYLWYLRVPWTARRSNQSILKESNCEYSLEGLMLKLKLKLQYLATWCKKPTHWKRPWCWERLRAEGKEGDRGWDGWMTSLTQWTWVCTNSSEVWRAAVHGVAKIRTWLCKWTTTPIPGFTWWQVCLVSPPSLIPCGIPLCPALFKIKKHWAASSFGRSLFSLISAFLPSDCKHLKGMNHHMLSNKHDFYG